MAYVEVRPALAGAGSPYSASFDFQNSTPTSGGLLSSTDLFAKSGGEVATLAEFALASYDVQTWEPHSASFAHTNDVKDGANQAKNDLIAAGWAPLTSLGLIPSPNASSGGSFQFGFQNGYYTSGNAAAFVARSADSVVIVFRGTNDNDGGFLVPDLNGVLTPDENSWLSMQDHYRLLLQPFVNAVDAYIANNSIQHVYVVGHSLGAGMVDAYMGGDYISARRIPSHAGQQLRSDDIRRPRFIIFNFRGERSLAYTNYLDEERRHPARFLDQADAR